MKKFILIFILTFGFCNVLLAETTVNLNIHGVIAKIPCQADNPDISVQLQEVKISDLAVAGGKSYGADYSIPVSCASGVTFALVFDGANDNNPAILNTTQAGVGLILECNDVAVKLGVPFLAGSTVVSNETINVPCKVFYTRKSNEISPFAGDISASMTYNITYF